MLVIVVADVVVVDCVVVVVNVGDGGGDGAGACASHPQGPVDAKTNTTANAIHDGPKFKPPALMPPKARLIQA